MNKILIFGNADFNNKEIGGSGIYTAVGLARLNSPVAFLTKINPENEKNLLDFLEINGVDTDYVICDDNDILAADDINGLDLSGICSVYFSGRTVASCDEKVLESLGSRCREQEIDIVFDPDSGGIDCEKYDILNRFAAFSDVFVPSIEDAEKLCGLNDPEKIAEHYLNLGTRKVVVTLDKNGAFYKSGKESGTAPTFRADKVVDTAGAGDAFAAGLISGISEDIPLGEAVVRANACGCMAIQVKGVLNSLPTMQQLREYMLSHRFVVEGCKEY